jgi:hypothetical protein
MARSRFVAFTVIGRVLFHELGHHIHLTTRPEFKEKEDVADDWSKRLMRNAVRRRHRFMRPFIRPAASTALLVLKSILFFKRLFKSGSVLRA